jgi:hypothetical protein
MAKHAGALFVTISEVKLDREELDELVEEASELNFPDEEASELVEAQWLQKVRRQSRLHPTRLRPSGHRLPARNHHRVVRALPGAARRHRKLRRHPVIDDPDGENEDL